MGAHLARGSLVLGSWSAAFAFRELCRPDAASAWWGLLAAGCLIGAAGLVLVLLEAGGEST
jgi:hypothetical protein